MPRIILTYVRWVDAINYRIGRVVMYGIFVMVAVLLWSSFSKTFFLPSRWTLEVAQFALVAYYLIGGPYSIQLAANVRMDLFYSSWTSRQRAWMDVFTIWFFDFLPGCNDRWSGRLDSLVPWGILVTRRLLSSRISCRHSLPEGRMRRPSNSALSSAHQPRGGPIYGRSR